MSVGATGAAVGNLPVYLTSLVGRRAELQELAPLLDTVRLLTLAGPGGSSKTRLALALAQEAAPELPGGAWWVELATVTDPALVGEQAVSSLGVPRLPARPPAEALSSQLRGGGAIAARPGQLRSGRGGMRRAHRLAAALLSRPDRARHQPAAVGRARRAGASSGGASRAGGRPSRSTTALNPLPVVELTANAVERAELQRRLGALR